MAAAIIAPLVEQLRTLRTIQAPDHLAPADDRPDGVRISSAAFKPGRDGSISVDLEQSLIAAGLSILARYPSLPRAVALVAHKVGDLKCSGLSVDHVPIEGNEHHGEVRFAGLSRSQLRDVARALADNCEIVVSVDVQEAERLRAERQMTI